MTKQHQAGSTPKTADRHRGRFAARLLCLVTALAADTLAQADDQKPAGKQTSGQQRANKVTGDERDQATFTTRVRPFLNTYCVGCHSGKKPKGDRRLDRLTGAIADDNALVDLQDVLDQLNLSEMPPQKAKQPSSAERQRVIQWLTERIARHHRERKPQIGQTVLRRLNSREYRNTIRDLLKLNMTMFDPTSNFPNDQTTEHLDNVGETLVTSGHLLAGYLNAAENTIDRALLPLQKPAVEKWVFRDGFRQQPEIDQVHRKTNRFNHMTLYDVVGADKPEGAYGPILAFKQGVPHDGFYEIRLKAEAVNRLHPYRQKLLGTDRDEPLSLGIVAGNYRAGLLHKSQPVEPLLAELDLADETKWYTARVWLDAGFTPRFTFRNGLMDVRQLWSRIVRAYPNQFPKLKKGGIVEMRFNAIKYGKLPHIRIHEIEISGPLYESWPTASQRAVLGADCERILKSGLLPASQLRPLLTRFLSQAYRRTPRPDEVDRLVQLAAARQKAGRSALDAYADALKAALCSPSFLYLQGPPRNTKITSPTRLTNAALATRLSYFLWSSMPDETLRRLADRNELQKPEVLATEVKRMLADAKSNALVDGFLGSWLNLRALGSTPPDRAQFRAFYHYDLDAAMRRETQLFTRNIMDRNLPLREFLDSKTTFVNKPLAQLYGITPPGGREFKQVQLPDRRRGGLLGQASVLTVTANGIDTSPVTRGVWILENILGTPPSPPPPDVEPLDPDIRGAKTVRDQLKKHRNVASCYDCHRKIDPLGFALENFDAIGRWRETYRARARVDAAGELPGGEKFDDIRGLKEILVRHEDQFARAVTNKLLAYALGRKLTPADRPHVDRILTATRSDDYRMQDLVRAVVLSTPFRSR